MSPFSAVSVLALFAKKAIPLTRRVYDEAWDALTSLLEKASDEQYRLDDPSAKAPDETVP